jgi:hypothetical protein
MSSIIPFGISKILQYANYLLQDNTEEDIIWMNQMIINMYYKLSEDAYKLYLLLTILNKKSFTGYFARHFNQNINKIVSNKDETGFINAILHPRIVEFESKALTKEEKTELTNLTSLDVMSTNMTISRMLTNDTIGENLEKAFEESRLDLYTKLYVGSIDSSKSEFQTFAIVSEYNPVSRTNHAYTFDIYSLLTGNISKQLNPETLKKVKETYSLEYKLITYKHNQ